MDAGRHGSNLFLLCTTTAPLEIPADARGEEGRHRQSRHDYREWYAPGKRCHEFLAGDGGYQTLIYVRYVSFCNFVIVRSILFSFNLIRYVCLVAIYDYVLVVTLCSL